MFGNGSWVNFALFLSLLLKDQGPENVPLNEIDVEEELEEIEDEHEQNGTVRSV